MTGRGVPEGGNGHSLQVATDTGQAGPAEHSEDPQEILDKIQARAAVEAHASPAHEYGEPGRRFDRRGPYLVAFQATMGVATSVALVLLVVQAKQILILLGLAFFIAVGLDPAVTWLARHRIPRWVAVTLVLAVALGAVVAFLAFAVVVTHATGLANNLPGYVRSVQDPNSSIGKLVTKYHLVTKLQTALNGSGTSVLAGGALKIGEEVFSVAYAILVVLILTIYLLADLPRVKRGIYRIAPRSRRPRMILLTDEILARVGGYVLGNLTISVISAIGTTAWALIFGIPYPLLLGVLVGLLDLIPIVGSTVGGVIVALVALASVGLPVAIATVAFYLLYRVVEDYVLTPRIMKRTIQVPGLVTVLAVLLGGAILGLVGALVAIPIAAGVQLLLKELAAPRLDQS
jgi:predicted PurR-regulated permease PerM